MTKKSRASLLARSAAVAAKWKTIRWGYQGRSHVSTVSPVPCLMCGAIAVIELPEVIRAQQPDGTTHVCHPMAGGCNHGFVRNDASTLPAPADE